MPAIPKFSSTIIETISRILADALTHRELTSLLQEAKIEEVGGTPKWERLKLALASRQQQDECANNVANFIRIALHPSRFGGKSDDHSKLLNEINVQLAYCELQLTEKMEFRQVVAARTLSEAETRANALQKKCRDRKIHDDILKYCSKEYLGKNFFHCVLEASKGLFEDIRQKSGMPENDGGVLVDKVFLGDNPKLALNKLVSVEERAEQSGFGNLLKGVYGLFRTPEAHAPRLKWSVNEQEALDALTVISYARRRVDEATRIP